MLPGALFFAPIAHADINDDLMFVRDVNKTGIPYDSRENLIWLGHEVCNALHSGNIEYDQAVQIMSTHGGGSIGASNAIASLAVSHICPDQWFQVVVAQIAFSPGDRVRI